MTALNPPGFLQNAGATHTAEQTRSWLGSMLWGKNASSSMQALGGVNTILGNGLTVTQTGSPSMAVLVRSGYAAVPGTEGTKQGAYFVGNDADVSVAVTAAHATLARIDIAVFTVRDSAYSGANNDSLIQVVAGTPAGSPAAPAAPANSIVLANIAVAAAVTSITNANITDMRRPLATMGGIPTMTSATRPLNSVQGQVGFETDLNRIIAFDTNWRGVVWIQNPFFSVRRTTTQSIPNGVSTPIDWTSEVSDRGNIVAVTFNTFTVPTHHEGIWLFTCQMRFVANSVGTRVLNLMHNGNQVAEDRRDPAVTGGQPSTMNVSYPILLVAGDTIQLTTFQGSGGALNVDGGSDAQNPKFSGVWLGR